MSGALELVILLVFYGISKVVYTLYVSGIVFINRKKDYKAILILEICQSDLGHSIPKCGSQEPNRGGFVYASDTNQNAKNNQHFGRVVHTWTCIGIDKVV